MLTTNLSASLDELVRLYSLRNWVEQSYKQMKDELDWADFMVSRDHAIRRHWTGVLRVCFCRWQTRSRHVRTSHPCNRLHHERCGKKIGNAKPPPAELATLLEAVTAGQGINLYLRS